MGLSASEKTAKSDLTGETSHTASAKGEGSPLDLSVPTEGDTVAQNIDAALPLDLTVKLVPSTSRF